MRQIVKRLPLLVPLLVVVVALPWLATASVEKPTQPNLRQTIADGPLAPASHYSDITIHVREVITRMHYAAPEFDSALSSKTFDQYLDILDPNRMFFLASDIAEFEQYRDRLIQRRRVSDLQPAYAMYNRFHQRLVERMGYLKSLLKQAPDFTVDEEFVVDRREAPWAETSAELDEITRKRFKNDALTLMLTGQNWDKVVETLDKRYRGIARRADQAVADDVFQAFMNALTTSVDPHTNYMTPQVQDNFRIDMSLSLEGIGAVLTSDDDYTRVVSIVPAGPADQSKALFPEDRVMGIAQGDEGEFVDIVGWRVDDVVQLVRGPKNTVVRLQVLPANAPPDAAPKVVRLERKKIRLEEQAAQKSVHQVERDGRNVRIGVIELPTFYADFAALQAGDPDAKSTTRDVRRLLTELMAENVDALILDLRGNGGGSLAEATDLAALFIGAGPVVQIRTGDGAVQVSRNHGTSPLYNGPLGVMIDRRSASGSEIFAGVIQDYGRGVIIGDRTFGKGTVQQLFPLDRIARPNTPRLGELKVTVAKFYRVSGGSNQHRGVIPDIALPTPFGDNGYGESERPTALPWDEIAPTRFNGYRELGKLVDGIRASHENRIAADKAYKLLTEEYSAAIALRARKSVSLNLEKRKLENQQFEWRRLALENARRQLRGLDPVESLADLERDEDGEDILLRESVEIIADLAGTVRRQGIVRFRPTGS